jgi:hypothetical protein
MSAIASRPSLSAMDSIAKTAGMKKIFLISALLAIGILALLRNENGTNSAPANLAPESRAAARRTAIPREDVQSLLKDIENSTALEDEGERAALFARSVEKLVKLDPAAALTWASALPDESERNLVLKSVCAEIAQSNPAAAIDAMERFGVLDDRSSIENFAQLWSINDISAATAWASAKPPGEPRDRLLARIAIVRADTEPSEAAEFLVKNVNPGEAQTEAAISILHRWALRDWDSARQWMDKFPEGPLRERAQNEITGIKSLLDVNPAY